MSFIMSHKDWWNWSSSPSNCHRQTRFSNSDSTHPQVLHQVSDLPHNLSLTDTGSWLVLVKLLSLGSLSINHFEFHDSVKKGSVQIKSDPQIFHIITVSDSISVSVHLLTGWSSVNSFCPVDVVLQTEHIHRDASFTFIFVIRED